MENLASKKFNESSFTHYAAGLEVHFEEVNWDNVENAFNIGNEKEANDALLQLIQHCQTKELPQSDTQKAKLLLCAFLKKMLPAEPMSSTHNVEDIDQLIAHVFKKALVLECEKFTSYQQHHAGYVFTPVSIDDNQKLHQLITIFHYLNDKVAHLDDQLFDEACYLYSQNKSVAASTIFHILLNSEIKDDASHMLDYLSKNSKFSLLRLNEFRPKCAFLNATFLNRHQPLNYILALTKLALEDSNEFALEEASKSEDPEVLEVLSEVFGDGDFTSKITLEATSDEKLAALKLRSLHTDGHLTDLKNRDLAASLKAKARQCEVVQSVRHDQRRRFNIQYDESIESRLEIGKNYLSKSAGKGVEILLSLTKLDHPNAKEANQILTTWLGKTENRLLLMQEYGVLTLSLTNTDNPYESIDVVRQQIFQKDYEKKFKQHLTILLEQVQNLNEQGNNDAARQLVHQLLEKEIQLELIKPHELNSAFYRLLIASPALDDIVQQEVQRRWEITKGKRPVNSLRECVDFNAPNRPWANYQLGLILKEDTSGLLLKAKEGRDHFKRASDIGLPAAKAALKKSQKITSSLDEYDIVDEAETFIKKHKARYFFDKDQSDLEHALSCYKWVADEFPGSEACRKAYATYLEYLPEMRNVNAKTLLEVGKEALDHFSNLTEHEVQNYLAVLDKAAKSSDVKVAAEAHLVLAKVYEEGTFMLSGSTVSTEPTLVVEKLENAAQHYYLAAKLGNKKASEDEVFFLAKQLLTSSDHPLIQKSTFVLRLKEIVDNKHQVADKESVRQASLALATYYSTGSGESLISHVRLFKPGEQGKEYEDIARRLSIEIESEQIEKTLSSNATNKPSQRELEAKKSTQLHLAALKHDLAEIYLNAIDGEQDILKATELFTEAANLEHQAMEIGDWEDQASMQYQASKEALVKTANELMKLNSYTTPELEALYKLSQVMDTLLSETEITFASGDVLLERAAKMGHPEAKTKFALKAEWDRNLIEENIRQAKLVEEQIRQANWELHREQHWEQYKDVGGSSKRNPDFYDKK